MLNFRQLKAFVTVIEQSSFTRAAKELYMTQPAISSQIRAMEESLDVQLLERLDKKVRLTEAGEVLYEQADKLLAIYEDILFALEELKQTKKGRLVLGASTIPGEYLLPRYIGAFKKQHPLINISLHISDTGSVIESLKNRKVDIGIIGAKVEDIDIRYQDFMEDELIVVAYPKHPLIGKAFSLRELIRHPMVLREPGSGTRMTMLRRLASHGIKEEELNIALELGSTRAVITAVESGLGLSIVSRFAAEEALALNHLAKLETPELQMARSLYIVTHRNRYLSHSARRILEFMNKPLES